MYKYAHLSMIPFTSQLYYLQLGSKMNKLFFFDGVIVYVCGEWVGEEHFVRLIQAYS